MEQTIQFEISKDEAARFSEMLNRCVTFMRESNERGLRKHAEFERISAETRAIQEQSLAEMTRHFAPRPYDAIRQEANVSTPSQPDEIALLKTQVIELWAAVRKAEEQRTHDQAEIAKLRAQMTELLANQPKQNF